VERLSAPTVHDLLAATHGGHQIGGDPALLGREAAGLVVAAMSLPTSSTG